MADLLSFENSAEFLDQIFKRLDGIFFNILTISDDKQLKFCNRQLRGPIFSKDGQASLPLKPGGSIAWDLNNEIVEVDLGVNGDILLSRVFKTGKKKTMLITRSPI